MEALAGFHVDSDTGDAPADSWKRQRTAAVARLGDVLRLWSSRHSQSTLQSTRNMLEDVAASLEEDLSGSIAAAAAAANVDADGAPPEHSESSGDARKGDSSAGRTDILLQGGGVGNNASARSARGGRLSVKKSLDLVVNLATPMVLSHACKDESLAFRVIDVLQAVAYRLRQDAATQTSSDKKQAEPAAATATAKTCPQGHPMQILHSGFSWKCDVCHSSQSGNSRLRCQQCDYDMCDPCVRRLDAATAVPSDDVESKLLKEHDNVQEGFSDASLRQYLWLLSELARRWSNSLRISCIVWSFIVRV